MPDERLPVIVACDVHTSYGHGIEPLWQGLLDGRTAFSPCVRFENENWKNAIAGLIPNIENEGTARIPEKLLRLVAPTARLLPDAAELFLTASVGEIEYLENKERRCTSDTLLEKALGICGKRSGQIVSAACASSNMALGIAASMIRAGRLDSATVIGLDYVSEFVHSGFFTLHAVSAGIPRPYDRDRDGLVLGDAAVAVNLCSLSFARKCGWKPLAIVAGWGSSCDATHVTAPMEAGDWLAEAARLAIRTAGVRPEDIGAVIGHGTATIYNDAMEINALKQLFPHESPPLLSVKGGCGHTLSAAGMVQTAAAIRMLETGVVPPQTSLHHPISGAETMVSNKIRSFLKPRVLSLNAGFGGLNSAVLLEVA